MNDQAGTSTGSDDLTLFGLYRRALTAQLGQSWGNPGSDDYLRYGQDVLHGTQFDAQMIGQSDLPGLGHVDNISATGFSGSGDMPETTLSSKFQPDGPRHQREQPSPTSPDSWASHPQAAGRPLPWYNNNVYSAPPTLNPQSQVSHARRQSGIPSGRHTQFHQDSSNLRNVNPYCAEQTYLAAYHGSPLDKQTTAHPAVPRILVTNLRGEQQHIAAPHHDASPIDIPSSTHSFTHTPQDSLWYNFSGQLQYPSTYKRSDQSRSMITPPADFHIMQDDEQENKRRKLSHGEELTTMARDPSPYRQPSPFLEQAPFSESMMHHDDQLPLELQSPEQEYATNRESKTHKRDVEIPINAEGKMICTHQPPFKECANLTFERRCEWGKHMDKHERPYKCMEPGCEKLQGFTYSGGLLRHQREVHKSGGVREPLFCDIPGCKRAAGNGFTRKENLAEHKRRVHQTASEDSTDTTDPNLVPGDVSEATVEETLQATIQGLQPLDNVPHAHGVVHEGVQDVVVSPAASTNDHFIEPSLRHVPSAKRKHAAVEQNINLELLIEENRRLREAIGDREKRLAALEANNAERDRKQALMEQVLKNAGLIDDERRMMNNHVEQYIPTGPSG